MVTKLLNLRLQQDAMRFEVLGVFLGRLFLVAPLKNIYVALILSAMMAVQKEHHQHMLYTEHTCVNHVIQ